MKACTRCGSIKSDDEFYFVPSGKRQSHCKTCNVARTHEWRLKNRERYLELGRANQRDRYTREKLALIDAYGGKCFCCGVSDPHFLTIEHKNGLPDHHRWPNGRRLSGLELLVQIRKEGYPNDYGVLCMNCNYARGHYGFCPHQNHDISLRRY